LVLKEKQEYKEFRESEAILVCKECRTMVGAKGDTGTTGLQPVGNDSAVWYKGETGCKNSGNQRQYWFARIAGT
jgi:hypothetical protein